MLNNDRRTKNYNRNTSNGDDVMIMMMMTVRFSRHSSVELFIDSLLCSKGNFQASFFPGSLVAV